MPDNHEDDALKFITLELKVDELRRLYEAEHETHAKLVTKYDELSLKVNRAETWGRAVIWTTIALGGIATQASSVVQWIKKV